MTDQVHTHMHTLALCEDPLWQNVAHNLSLNLNLIELKNLKPTLKLAAHKCLKVFKTSQRLKYRCANICLLYNVILSTSYVISVELFASFWRGYNIISVNIAIHV